MYNKALKSTYAHGWGFKRFGTLKDAYAREMMRKPSYKEYIDSMEQASEAALQQLSAKERMLLMRSRTAFIYVDSWGESGPFEDISSALHTSMIDTLPKNLVKKFSVKDFTCKMRGEKQSLMQAMRVAQDYLNWGVFDNVVICAAYRAVPVLVFSEEDIVVDKKNKEKDIKMNLSVERVGCFIFSNRESGLKVSCGDYFIPGSDANLRSELLKKDPDIDLISFACLRKNALMRELINNNKQHASEAKAINLIDIYGGSGCLSPALSWIYLEQHACSQGKMRTIVRDNFGGYNYFDTWY